MVTPMLAIDEIRHQFSDEAILLTDHLRSRMRQRGITYSDLKSAIDTGEIIEQYPDDYPFPSCLISSGDLHLVCSVGNQTLYIITAYRPSSEKWEIGGKIRKGKL